MKFNSITTETKFKYLSKRALGTANYNDTTCFDYDEIKVSNLIYAQTNTSLVTVHKIKKPKALKINGENIVPFFDNFDGDYHNILIEEHALCETSDGKYRHTAQIVRNLSVNTINHLSDNNTSTKEIHFKLGQKTGRYAWNSFGTNVETIENLDWGNCQNAGPILCPKLRNIKNWTNLNISLNISKCTLLSRETLVQLFTETLLNVTTTQTITLGSTLLAKLTDEDKKIATDKGWTLA